MQPAFDAGRRATVPGRQGSGARPRRPPRASPTGADRPRTRRGRGGRARSSPRPPRATRPPRSSRCARPRRGTPRRPGRSRGRRRSVASTRAHERRQPAVVGHSSHHDQVVARLAVGSEHVGDAEVDVRRESTVQLRPRGGRPPHAPRASRSRGTRGSPASSACRRGRRRAPRSPSGSRRSATRSAPLDARHRRISAGAPGARSARRRRRIRGRTAPRDRPRPPHDVRRRPVLAVHLEDLRVAIRFADAVSLDHHPISNRCMHDPSFDCSVCLVSGSRSPRRPVTASRARAVSSPPRPGSG